MHALGIDIGGTGIKGSVVDTETGELVDKRFRVATPQPATPEAVLIAVKEVADHFNWHEGPLGCTFPGVIRRNVVHTAANMDSAFVSFDLGAGLRTTLNIEQVSVMNDADAAGFAEIRLGAGKDAVGLVILLTVGTGLGTALFNGGRLVANSELGHIVHKGADAELQLSEVARKRKHLSRKRWAKQFQGYLNYLEALLWPELFILGGGGAKKPERFASEIITRTPVAFARFRNQAGIIGAAIAAAEGLVVE
jgi:polyphosphate glucokinase